MAPAPAAAAPAPAAAAPAPEEDAAVKRFWEIIDASRAAAQGNNDAHARALRERLDALDQTALASFNAVWLAYRDALDRREDLWGAIYTIRGGCSDDCHSDFVAWLVGQGRAVVNQVVRDPQALAEPYEAWKDSVENEALLYTPRDAYEERFGELDISAHAVREIADWPRDAMASGLKWERDVLHQHFPKLVEAYWDR